MEVVLRSIGVCAGALVSLWGVVKIVASLIDGAREKREKVFRELERRMEAVCKQLEGLEKLCRDNADSVASLQCECLNRSFAEYVEKGKPCPLSVRQSIAAMYEAYRRDETHNHLAQDYMERLMALPAE